MGRVTVAVLAVWVALGLGGCGGTRIPNERIQAVAERTFTGEGLWVTLEVPHAGAAEEVGRALDPAGAPFNRQTRELAAFLSRGSRERIALAITGRSSRKTAEVLIRALEAQERPIDQMHILFIGDPEHERAVRAAVEEAGAQFSFAPFEALDH